MVFSWSIGPFYGVLSNNQNWKLSIHLGKTGKSNAVVPQIWVREYTKGLDSKITGEVYAKYGGDKREIKVGRLKEKSKQQCMAIFISIANL